jgi:hypothetical protein
VDNLGNTPDCDPADTESVRPGVNLTRVTRPSGSDTAARDSYFLTAQQVADLFGVTKSTVNRWREARAIEAHPLPSSGRQAQRLWRYPAHQPVIVDALRALRPHR